MKLPLPLVELRLHALEPFGVERLDGIGGPRDERVRVLFRGEIREHVVRALTLIAPARPTDAHAQAKDATGGALAFGGAGLALLARACVAGSRALAFGALRGFLALRQFLALLQLLGLRLDFADREADARENRFLRIVQVGDAVDRRQVGQAESVADRHAADVEVDVLRNLHRQRLDIDLALHLREHAALLRTDGLADQLDGDARLDRLVEPHLLEIDVRDVTADRILLVVLEDRGMGRRLALEHDVEDRVEPAGAGQHTPEIALRHADRIGAFPLPVEDAGDEPLLAQPPSVGGAARLALLHRQPDSL